MVVKHHINAILLFSIIAANTKAKNPSYTYIVFTTYSQKEFVSL